jgi:hypothetical protein
MKLFRILMAVTIVIFLLVLSGCCCGGGTDKVVVEHQTAPAQATDGSGGGSVGDEVLKLQEAKEKGALTDEEFEGAKKKLLEEK